MKAYRLFLAISLYFLCIMTKAEVVMPPLFSDGMVLQQESDVKIWGSSDPGNDVYVITGWDSKMYSCKSAPNGNWSVKVGTPAAGGPYDITICCGTEHVIHDVMIGEVWICSGQSNMEMPVKGFLCQPVEDAMQMMLEAGDSEVRAFTVGRQLSDSPMSICTGKWVTASSGTVPDISAVAYTFAHRLSRFLDVPVGIIVSAWGGTSILGWLPEESVSKTISPEELERILDVNRSEKNHPGKLYNGMIAPLLGYGARGFVWYQGEANVGFPDAYGRLISRMVSTWRHEWGPDGNKMPFYAVEIAPYRYGKGHEKDVDRPMLVDAQKKALSKLGNTAMIPTSDAGDIVCIHPAKKRVVGDRLAVTALDNVYGVDGFESVSPEVAKIVYKEGSAIVYTTSELGPSPSNAPVEGFEIAGKDGYFYKAKALVDRKSGTFILTAEEVPEPVAVRYAFHNYIKANWTNWMGIPALPYRSDDWTDK